ncbi:MAG TPA: hypothetical protein VG963_07600 [Polyangiaceae bacterium]|nr:hypothetical protein [Polyangiaceae bacterium]
MSWPWSIRAPLAAACVSVGMLSAPAALAHAPPQVYRIVWKNDRELVLVTNRGLMFGEADEPDYRLMCIEALHINTGEEPHAAYRGDGALLAATSQGLFFTTDEGCTWTAMPPLTGMLVPALTQLPGQPDTLFAATFATGQSAIRVTHDGGNTWTTLAALEDQDYTRTLKIAPQDPSLLYATGTQIVRMPAPVQQQYIARSRDGGQTWERNVVMLTEDELSLNLLAIHPTQSDVLLAKTGSSSPGYVDERLMLSRDGGKTFDAVLMTSAVNDAAFASDGNAAWVAGNDGLWKSGPTFDDFQRIGVADHLSCVEETHGRLWACGHYTGTTAGLAHDGVGSAAPDATTFDPFMDFTHVTSEVSCDDSSPTPGLCEWSWQDFMLELLPYGAADGGAPLGAADAGVDTASATQDASAATAHQVDAATASPERASSGCAMLANRRNHPAWAWLLGLVCLRRKRRRAPA